MTKKGVAVVAIGGNSLIKDKDHKSIPDQYAAAAESMHHIADMIEQGWDVVITHGNGPQVGFMLRRSELSLNELHPVPLDYCGANTQGSIGYMLVQTLHKEFLERKIDKQAVALVTRCVVEKNDPAFQDPTKPIGSFMTDEAEAKKMATEAGWTIKEDAGRGWRRVVASPFPTEIYEANAIKALIDLGYTVIGVGGGGIPVVRDEKGNLTGIEAVIDKDFASALLAATINADVFVISTAVEKVALNYNKPNEKQLDKITLAEAKQYLEEG
ncbi:MAG TPA: carbamate kinase, partial [Planctomycetota bacterium]|nr:carbamate kinase [Planctomycetota bacterium]